MRSWHWPWTCPFRPGHPGAASFTRGRRGHCGRDRAECVNLQSGKSGWSLCRSICRRRTWIHMGFHAQFRLLSCRGGRAIRRKAQTTKFRPIGASTIVGQPQGGAVKLHLGLHAGSGRRSVHGGRPSEYPHSRLLDGGICSTGLIYWDTRQRFRAGRGHRCEFRRPPIHRIDSNRRTGVRASWDRDCMLRPVLHRRGRFCEPRGGWSRLPDGGNPGNHDDPCIDRRRASGSGNGHLEHVIFWNSTASESHRRQY